MFPTPWSGISYDLVPQLQGPLPLGSVPCGINPLLPLVLGAPSLFGVLEALTAHIIHLARALPYPVSTSTLASWRVLHLCILRSAQHSVNVPQWTLGNCGLMILLTCTYWTSPVHRTVGDLC